MPVNCIIVLLAEDHMVVRKGFRNGSKRYVGVRITEQLRSAIDLFAAVIMQCNHPRGNLLPVQRTVISTKCSRRSSTS